MNLFLDLVEVCRAVTMLAEGWELATATEENFRWLITTALILTDFTIASFDAEEILVSRARIFKLLLK